MGIWGVVIFLTTDILRAGALGARAHFARPMEGKRSYPFCSKGNP